MVCLFKRVQDCIGLALSDVSLSNPLLFSKSNDAGSIYTEKLL